MSNCERPGVPYRVIFPRLAHFLIVASDTPEARAATFVGTSLEHGGLVMPVPSPATP